MKTALYFGTFDPIHIYHEAIVNHLIQHEGMDKVVVIVSPQSPHKTENTPFIHRALMTIAALKKYKDKVHVSQIEQNMQKPSYTIDTLKELEKVYNGQFYIVMGFDNWVKIKTWKNWKTIIKKYPILVIPRSNKDENAEFEKYMILHKLQGTLFHEETQLITGILHNEVSSTFIRNEIRNGFNVSPYLNEEVYNYIKNKNFYK